MTVRPDTHAFADPGFLSQAVFRAVMNAMARPGTILGLPVQADAPPALPPELAAIAVALCDHETAVWLDVALDAPDVADYLRFNTGCELTDKPAAAAFAFAAAPGHLPPLDAFAQGSDLYPDRSTTLVLAVQSLTTGPVFDLRGPGIKDRAALAVAPLPAGFLAQRAANHARFPRGVDCVLVADGAVVALARTTAVTEG